MTQYILKNTDCDVRDTTKKLIIKYCDYDILSKIVEYKNVQELCFVNYHNKLNLENVIFDNILSLTIIDYYDYSDIIFLQIYNNFPNLEKLLIFGQEWLVMINQINIKNIIFRDSIKYLVLDTSIYPLPNNITFPKNLQVLKTTTLFYKYPESLLKLVFYDGIYLDEKKLDDIIFPSNLKILHVNSLMPHIIDILPDSIEELKILSYINPIYKLPKSLNNLWLPIFYKNNEALKNIKNVKFYDAQFSTKCYRCDYTDNFFDNDDEDKKFIKNLQYILQNCLP